MAFVQVPLFTDNDVADLERMNAIVSNLNHLEQSKVTVRYNAHGVIQTDQIRIAAGAIRADNPTGSWRTRWITITGFFTPGSNPVGMATWASDNARRSTIAVTRRAVNNPILDHTGMRAIARYINNDVLFTGPNYINWLMIGY